MPAGLFAGPGGAAAVDVSWDYPRGLWRIRGGRAPGDRFLPEGGRLPFGRRKLHRPGAAYGAGDHPVPGGALLADRPGYRGPHGRSRDSGLPLGVRTHAGPVHLRPEGCGPGGRQLRARLRLLSRRGAGRRHPAGGRQRQRERGTGGRRGPRHGGQSHLGGRLTRPCRGPLLDRGLPRRTAGHDHGRHDADAGGIRPAGPVPGERARLHHHAGGPGYGSTCGIGTAFGPGAGGKRRAGSLSEGYHR